MSDINEVKDSELNEVSGGGANGQYWDSDGARYYRIAYRDTLSEIAARFGVDMWSIQRLNPDKIKNVNLIREGDVIRIW